jgi:hypothetical protein
MLLGIWVLGGVFMTIGASFSGGGFANGISSGLVIVAMSLVPVYTFIMATYDGSLFALLLISFVLFLAWSKRLFNRPLRSDR